MSYNFDPFEPEPSVINHAHFDAVSGSITFGQSYGEFSINGQPLYSGSLTCFWEPHTQRLYDPLDPLGSPPLPQFDRLGF